MKELSLVECRIQDFNPDEVPSSLETLDLQNNRLQTFNLTKPLVNLIKLDLSNNFLTRFILDMQYLLPNIKTVFLEKNKLTDFQPIDTNLNHTLEHLNLDGNQIRNMDAYEWILQNRHLTNISWIDNFPICDCSSEETLNQLYEEGIVENCVLPVPGDVQVHISNFQCPSTDSRDFLCPFFQGIYSYFL